jgi:hypothetical protein
LPEESAINTVGITCRRCLGVTNARHSASSLPTCGWQRGPRNKIPEPGGLFGRSASWPQPNLESQSITALAAALGDREAIRPNDVAPIVRELGQRTI